MAADSCAEASGGIDRGELLDPELREIFKRFRDAAEAAAVNLESGLTDEVAAKLRTEASKRLDEGQRTDKQLLEDLLGVGIWRVDFTSNSVGFIALDCASEKKHWLDGPLGGGTIDFVVRTRFADGYYVLSDTGADLRGRVAAEDEEMGHTNIAFFPIYELSDGDVADAEFIFFVFYPVPGVLTRRFGDDFVAEAKNIGLEFALAVERKRLDELMDRVSDPIKRLASPTEGLDALWERTTRSGSELLDPTFPWLAKVDCNPEGTSLFDPADPEAQVVGHAVRFESFPTEQLIFGSHLVAWMAGEQFPPEVHAFDSDALGPSTCDVSIPLFAEHGQPTGWLVIHALPGSQPEMEKFQALHGSLRKLLEPAVGNSSFLAVGGEAVCFAAAKVQRDRRPSIVAQLLSKALSAFGEVREIARLTSELAREDGFEALEALFVQPAGSEERKSVVALSYWANALVPVDLEDQVNAALEGLAEEDVAAIRRVVMLALLAATGKGQPKHLELVDARGSGVLRAGDTGLILDLDKSHRVSALKLKAGRLEWELEVHRSPPGEPVNVGGKCSECSVLSRWTPAEGAAHRLVNHVRDMAPPSAKPRLPWHPKDGFARPGQMESTSAVSLVKHSKEWRVDQCPAWLIRDAQALAEIVNENARPETAGLDRCHAIPIRVGSHVYRWLLVAPAKRDASASEERRAGKLQENAVRQIQHDARTISVALETQLLTELFVSELSRSDYQHRVLARYENLSGHIDAAYQSMKYGSAPPDQEWLDKTRSLALGLHGVAGTLQREVEFVEEFSAAGGVVSLDAIVRKTIKQSVLPRLKCEELEASKIRPLLDVPRAGWPSLQFRSRHELELLVMLLRDLLTNSAFHSAEAPDTQEAVWMRWLDHVACLELGNVVDEEQLDDVRQLTNVFSRVLELPVVRDLPWTGRRYSGLRNAFNVAARLRVGVEYCVAPAPARILARIPLRRWTIAKEGTADAPDQDRPD